MDAASLRLDVHRNMSTLGISQWTSPANAVEKVEEMLSKAINYQKDLWDILVVQSTESDPTREMRQGDLIPPQLLKSLKSKLENSMDSCNSALNRLKDIMVQTTSLPSLASPENLELQKEWNTYVGSFFLNELSQLSSGPQTCKSDHFAINSPAALAAAVAKKTVTTFSDFFCVMIFAE